MHKTKMSSFWYVNHYIIIIFLKHIDIFNIFGGNVLITHVCMYNIIENKNIYIYIYLCMDEIIYKIVP